MFPVTRISASVGWLREFDLASVGAVLEPQHVTEAHLETVDSSH
jgi:hypothetical protein